MLKASVTYESFVGVRCYVVPRGDKKPSRLEVGVTFSRRRTLNYLTGHRQQCSIYQQHR